MIIKESHEPIDLKHSTVDMYADDTLIYVCYKDINENEKKLNEDLQNPSIWLINNHMKVNVSKTKGYVTWNNCQNQ